MARYQFRGRGALVFAITVGTKSAPTVAEITAGTKLHPQMTNDGIDLPKKGKTVDIADASDLFDKTMAGSYGGDMGQFVGFRDSKLALDVAWTALADGATGFLIVAPTGWAQDTNGLGTPTGTPTTGDRCEVWPTTVISRVRDKPGNDKATTFTAAVSFPDSPVTTALVA